MARPIRLLSSSILVLVIAITVTAQQKVAPVDLVGSYIVGHQFGGSLITLKADGSFVNESSDCTTAYIDSGSYSLSESRLLFTVRKERARSFSDNKEIDLRNPKARKKLFGPDNQWEPTTDFELRVVKWGGRTYLMNESYFEPFVNAINLSLEPRRVEFYRSYYGPIYLRQGDENKDVSGTPTLPQRFLTLLLPEPVTATILEIHTRGEEILGTINRGSKHGLRENMVLVAMENDSWYFEGYAIVSVTDETASVRLSKDFKPGDQLTTKIKDVRRLA